MHSIAYFVGDFDYWKLFHDDANSMTVAIGALIYWRF